MSENAQKTVSGGIAKVGGSISNRSPAWILRCRKNFFFVGKFSSKNTKFVANNIRFGTNWSKKILKMIIYSVFCQKFVAVCRKIATFCSYFFWQTTPLKKMSWFLIQMLSQNTKKIYSPSQKKRFKLKECKTFNCFKNVFQANIRQFTSNEFRDFPRQLSLHFRKQDCTIPSYISLAIYVPPSV